MSFLEIHFALHGTMICASEFSLFNKDMIYIEVRSIIVPFSLSVCIIDLYIDNIHKIIYFDNSIEQLTK